MDLDSLRQGRKGATAVFTAFTRMKHLYGNSIFCCFESDDAKYYFKRIEDNTNYKPGNIIVLNCEGKSEVLRFQTLVKDKEEYKSVRLMYFIDKDFDPPIKKQDDIYETSMYSIENFYTTTQAFIRILKIEFGYNECDEEFQLLSDLFLARQADFHNKTLLLNAWLSCQRDKFSMDSTQKLRLNDFNISKIIPKIDLDTIESNYNLGTLESTFPDATKVTSEEIDEKIKMFDKLRYQELFRGKFEIDFLFAIIEAIKVEFNKPNGRFKKKSGVKINQSKKNIIAEFSQYACTSDCLIKYLNYFKVSS